jgi:hypothetical protein
VLWFTYNDSKNKEKKVEPKRKRKEQNTLKEQKYQKKDTKREFSSCSLEQFFCFFFSLFIYYIVT